MTLHSDLSRLIKGQLDKNSISYDGSMPLHRLVARYFEMNVRHIHPVPRRVHFSDQTHASLGKLLRPDHDTSARDAWGTVFRLRQLIFDGANVNAFLSKNIRSATGWDGLLWHYGMHHFQDRRHRTESARWRVADRRGAGVHDSRVRVEEARQRDRNRILRLHKGHSVAGKRVDA